MSRILASVALLSGALIAFQLVLMHILSIVQWYHFASMIISVALLGFGASGTLITFTRAWFLERSHYISSLLMILSGVAMAVVVGVSQHDAVRFDSYLLLSESGQIRSLVLTYVAFFVPFFLGALALGLLFVWHVDQIGKLYAANLFGSGLGGLGAIVLLLFFMPQQLPSVVALVPIAAGTLTLPFAKKRVFVLLSIPLAGIAVYYLVMPPRLHPSQYKSIERALHLPDAKIVFERNSPHGFVQVVSSSALRYAPGVSLTWSRPIPSHDVVFNNGDWFGPLMTVARNETSQVSRYTTFALPYALKHREHVLVLQARTGMFVTQAIEQGAISVDAVEPHSTVLSLLRKEYASASDSLLFHPAVRVHTMDARTFLLTDTSHYDLIILPTLDAFGGASGMYALQEQYLLTKEAFTDMWNRLSFDGVMCVTSWMDYPARNSLRVLATLVETLDGVGVKHPAEHIAAIRSWGTITFIAKRTSLAPHEVENIREYSRALLFDPALLPNIDAGERNQHNILQDASFFSMLDSILSERREKTYTNYDFDIEPTTDNRPYFSQFLRWQSVPRLRELFGRYAFPFLELGTLIITVTLAQVSVLALVVIFLPLFKQMKHGSLRIQPMLYFGTLGLAYMFVEMLFIQRFVLYFGQQLYAAAAVISAMLVFSGFGSLVSSRLVAGKSALRKIAVSIAFLIAAYTLVMTPILRHTISLSLPARMLITCIVIAPPATIMGMLFPLGIRHLATHNSDAVPWAWGINGCMSVIAAPLATLIAVELGFVVVMLIAAALYAVAALSVKLPPDHLTRV
jgi:spermidine synthase